MRNDGLVLLACAFCAACDQPAPSGDPASVALEVTDAQVARGVDTPRPTDVDFVLIAQGPDDAEARVIMDTQRGDDPLALGVLRFDPDIPAAFRSRAAAAGAREAQPRSLRVLEEAIAVLRAQPAAVVDLTIELREPSTRLTALRDPATDRESLIATREAEIRALQAPLAAWVREHHGEVLEQFWIANLIRVRLPRDHVAALAGQTEVLALSGPGSPLPAGGWDGDEVGAALRTDTAWSLGFTGTSAAGPIRLGIIESINAGATGNWPMQLSPVWQTSGPIVTNRIAALRDCRSSGCPTASNPATDDPQLHGALVTALAAASIMDGQDPAYSTSLERRRRSGVARGAEIRYYHAGDCDSSVRALQQAVSDGVRITNNSYSGPGVCDRNYNCSGMNTAIANALEGNSVSVFVTGNGHTSGGGCSLEYPSWRSDVLGVGALAGGSADTTPSYESRTIWGSSSRGPMQVRFSDGSMHFISGVGLVTIGGDFDHVMSGPVPRGGTPTFYGITLTGTSGAAPLVSGGAVLFLDAMRDMGLTIYSRDLLTNLLLMGDGFNGSTIADHSLSHTYGMGRFRVLYPHSALLGTPFGWGYGGAFLPVGTSVRSVGAGGGAPGGRETGVTQWRWVTTLLENDLNNVQSDYIIRVVDACAPGRPVIAIDDSFDLRKRIQLTGTAICPTPSTCRCLEMETIVLVAPPGGARIHTADFFRGSGGVTGLL